MDAVRPYVVAWISTEVQSGTPHLPHVSDTFYSLSHNLWDPPDHQGVLFQSMEFLTFLGLCTELLGHCGAYCGPFSICCWDNSGPEWISSLRALVLQYPGLHNEAEGHASLGEGVPNTTWNYPGQAPKLLDVRSPETAGATTEEMDNCLGRRVCRQIVS
jgi:hypothetical protein